MAVENSRKALTDLSLFTLSGFDHNPCECIDQWSLFYWYHSAGTNRDDWCQRKSTGAHRFFVGVLTEFPE